MSGVSGILLAAGESRRMSPANKLELAVEGEPLLRRTARVLLASRLDRLLVVVGHDAARAIRLVEDLPFTIVRNEHYAQGQMTSVYRGLEELPGSPEGIMICLSDQPLLTTEDVDALIDAFLQRERGSILVPTYQGHRGNPIVVANAHRDEILSGGRNLGCKRLIERNPEWVTTIEMDSDNVVFDLDTPENYDELQRRLGQSRAA